MENQVFLSLAGASQVCRGPAKLLVRSVEARLALWRPYRAPIEPPKEALKSAYSAPNNDTSPSHQIFRRNVEWDSITFG